MELVLQTHEGASALAATADLKPIYFDAYSDAPYHYNQADADEFVERFSGQTERPSFRLILGRIDGEIAGFSYGYTFPTDLWWRGAQTEPPAEVAIATKFAVIELVVSRSHRGHGYSRVLLDALLADRSEDCAILLAKPGAQAHDMYLRWGWQNIGVVQSYPHWPVDDAFVLPLHDGRRAHTERPSREDPVR